MQTVHTVDNFINKMIGHHKEFLKLTFCVLALHQSKKTNKMG